jgi:hypothetical protein
VGRRDAVRLCRAGCGALTDPRVIVRWTDHSETRWEHQRGVVRRIKADAEWSAVETTRDENTITTG